jgi:hypothetical protein
VELLEFSYQKYLLFRSHTGSVLQAMLAYTAVYLVKIRSKIRFIEDTPDQPPIQWLPGLKRLVCEADHSSI